MRDHRKVETGQDRKALARHAGMGPISLISVLAGALCGIAIFEALAAVAGGLGVAINDGTNFASMGDRQFKTVTGVVLVVITFCAFVVGGYVSGRMSRRRGAAHGLLAGVVGVVFGALVTATVVGAGADTALARVAQHIQVTASWQQWRSFSLVAALILAAAMLLGGLAGGVDGERWHAELLTRAVDPGYGPEAEDRAEARKRATDAEVARLAAAERVGQVTGATKVSQNAPTVAQPVATTPTATPTRADEPTRLSRAHPAHQDREYTEAVPQSTQVPAARRPRHLLGRH